MSPLNERNRVGVALLVLRITVFRGGRAERMVYNDSGEITSRAFPLVAARDRALRRLANATRVVCETAERKAGRG